MKVTTIVKFKDLKENVMREIGDEFEVSEKRFNEILSVGEFVEVIEETTEKVDLNKLTINKLKEILDEKGIEYKKNATKAELIELIGE